MENQLVSIIIPTYNRAGLLTKTLESIANQSYTNIEIIIVSDGSTDNTKQIVELKNDKRIRFFEFETNTNLPAKVRNFGLAKAMGEFIAFCDDDDIWLKNKLKNQMKIMQQNPKIGLCCTAMIFLYPDGNTKKYQNILFYLKHVLASLNIIPAKYLLVAMNHIVNSSVLIRRNIIEQVGYITEDPQWRASEDFHYWLSISKITKIFYLNKQCLLYRLHQNQISSDKAGKERFLKILSRQDLDLVQRCIFYLKRKSTYIKFG